MQFNTLIFYGSVRTERQGIKAARYISNYLKSRNHNVKLIDPKDYDFGLLDKMYKELTDEEAPQKMIELGGMIKVADGFMIVSGEYNHSIPPALTNLMDHFLEEYLFRPSAIMSYSAGRFGGVRAAMQLRAFLTEIGTVSIPSIFPIPDIEGSFKEDGTPLKPWIDENIERFVREFEWYEKTMKYGRENFNLPY